MKNKVTSINRISKLHIQLHKKNYTLIFTKSNNIFFQPNTYHIRMEIRVAEFAWKLG